MKINFGSFDFGIEGKVNCLYLPLALGFMRV